MTKALTILLTLLLLTACSEAGESSAVTAANGDRAAPTANSEVSEVLEDGEPRMTLEQIQAELSIPVLSEPWFGDLDGMLERRVIRVLTVYGLGTYFIDNGQERGIVYEMFKMFEDEINKREGNSHVRVHVVFIPVARDELFAGLVEGHGDIAAAGLTITSGRETLVDFTDPISRELSEILVTGPSAPALASIEDLSGREVYVRASSSYRASLEVTNERLIDAGLEPIIIQELSEFLEDLFSR